MHEADRLLMINQINLNLETAFPRFVSQESLSFILLLKSKALHRKVSKYIVPCHVGYMYRCQSQHTLFKYFMAQWNLILILLLIFVPFCFKLPIVNNVLNDKEGKQQDWNYL